MFYTLFLAVCTLLTVVLISLVCYFLLLAVSRTRRKYRVYIVMPDGENADTNCAGSEKNMRKMIERYNRVKFVQIGDMPDVISFYWDD